MADIFKGRGNEPATSANPPVLANGKISAATDKIYKG
jgi:hypothetical protein